MWENQVMATGIFSIISHIVCIFEKNSKSNLLSTCKLTPSQGWNIKGGVGNRWVEGKGMNSWGWLAFLHLCHFYKKNISWLATSTLFTRVLGALCQDPGAENNIHASSYSFIQGQQIFFCKSQDSKYFRLCGPYMVSVATIHFYYCRMKAAMNNT